MDTATKSTAVSPASPSRDWLKIASVALVLVGLFITGYLTYTKLANTAIACVKTSVIDCDAVQHSAYSTVGPIPVVYLGLFGYIVIFLALALETNIPILATRGKLIVFALTLFGILFSGYLTSIEAFVLHQWCEWCLGSAAVMTGLFILSFARLWRSMNVIPDEDDEE